MIYTLKAPAKINIGLRILSKRKDGFHNIETIFYPIPLFDIVKVDIRRMPSQNVSIEMTTDSPELKDGRGNICCKAAILFFKKFEIKGYRIKINIKKNIPIGAGLGGGSSDGAAVLRILCRHFETKSEVRSQISERKVKRIAGMLGSDVTYFINDGLRITNYELKPAYATGRGEKLKLLPGFKINYPMLVVYPGIRISTKWAYKKIKNQKSKIKKLKEINKFNVQELKLFNNDFEDIVFKKYPSIKKIKDKMYESGAMFSSLSGSGSAVYGIFEDSNGLGKCKKDFERKGYKAHKVK